MSARVDRVVAAARAMSNGAAEFKPLIRRRRSHLLKIYGMDGTDLASFCRAVAPATVCVRPATAQSKSRLDVYCPAEGHSWLWWAALLMYAVAAAAAAAAAAIVRGRN